MRLLREHSELTLRALAARTGLSTATLSAAEAGRRLPSWKVSRSFVQACSGDLDDWQERWENADRLSALRPAPRPADVRSGTSASLSTRRGPLGGPPPIPVAAETSEEFMDCLLRVKIWAGDPPVRELARIIGLPPSTMGDFLRPRTGGRLPAVETICKFLEACGVHDQGVIDEWVYAWRRLRYAETGKRRRPRRHLRSA